MEQLTTAKGITIRSSSALNFAGSRILQKYQTRSERISLAKTRTVQDEASDILGAPGRVLIPVAIRRQLESIRDTGTATIGGSTFTPSLGILASITKMLYYSLHQNRTANPAFAILSYLRNGSRHHSNGTAVDLAIVNGFAIDVRNQQGCLSAIVASIKNLAPGNYALGLPRPPRTDPDGAATDAQRYRHLHLYDTSSPPQLLPAYQSLPRDHYFLGAEFNERYVPGGITGGLSRINNGTARTQLTDAINFARNNGANVLHLMADALDHLHIQQI